MGRRQVKSFDVKLQPYKSCVEFYAAWEENKVEKMNFSGRTLPGCDE
jgi:hypothetical protein